MSRISSSSCPLVVLLAVQDAQDRKKQVDDVQIQADGGGNLLFNVVVAHDQLGINENIPTEDQSGQPAVDQLAGATVGEEHGHEAEQQQAPESTEQVGHPAGEVIFCLAGERRQENKDTGGKENGVEDNRGVVD